MKNLPYLSRFYFFLALLWSLSPFLGLAAQGVTVGSNNPPHPSAGLEVDFTNRGFLLPRLTTAQRATIPTPTPGLQIFNTTTQCVETYFSGGWRATACECSTAPATPSAISGSSDFCVNQTGLTYSVTPQADASNYTWSIPPGATLVSGQGSNSIALNLGSQSGVISVTASNSCGTSAASSLTVNPSIPSAVFTPLTGSINNAVTFSGPAGMSSYAWTFTGGTPATASTQNPQVTWTNAGTYAVTLTVTNSVGCTATLTQSVVISLCQPLTQTFTPCGATGRLGPSQSQCNTAYGPGVVTVNNGIQTWVVPQTGTYQITAAGARGGPGQYGFTGGNGGVIQGTFTLTQGESIQLLVGQMGLQSTGTSTYAGGGGGGGSYVVRNSSLLIAGGGGGGASGRTSGPNGGAAQSGNSGASAIPHPSEPSVAQAAGGNGGNGGNAGTGNPTVDGSGGAGYTGNGNGSTGGFSYVNGGAGGNGDGKGGFGGGGSSGLTGSGYHGGGGGGYSGGGGGSNSGSATFGQGGGGGGSFNTGSNTSFSATNTGQGYITITRICP
jgi:hypothetical protein